MFRVIDVKGATEHNLKNIDVVLERGKMTVITGVSGSGKSSLAFDTILAEAQRRFFYTLSHYSRQFLDLGNRPSVKSITGLSPAIALAQNETAPSRRATLGTLTDTSELLAVMFARFGTQCCPKHNLPTQSMSVMQIVDHIVSKADGEMIAIVLPLATAKKGVFRTQLQSYFQKGYSKAWIDGEMANLSAIPDLAREEKHTIKIVIDQLRVKSSARDRLRRAVETTMSLADGFGEWLPLDGNVIDVKNASGFSLKGGCAICGFSWPKLDSRYFSANSLGRCLECNGYGSTLVTEESGADEDAAAADVLGVTDRCAACAGTGVHQDAGAIKLCGHSIQDLLNKPIVDLRGILKSLQEGELSENPAFERVYAEFYDGLERLIEMRLGYLTLSRRIRSLSGGETQRVKLAGVISESLRGIMYVLDEPSQGLHSSELKYIIKSLHRLRDQGNTVIVVDHDETIISAADWIVDLGPGGGAEGGAIVGRFAPAEALHFKDVSRTAAWLVRPKRAAKLKTTSAKGRTYIKINKPHLHNLQIDAVKFLKGGMTVVSGVSGAGKSSLVLGTLFPNLFAFIESHNAGRKPSWFACRDIEGLEDLNEVHLIDRKPITKSSVSMPVTYLDIMADLRDLYSSLPDAQIRGLTAKNFSTHSEGGRCEECRGRGEVSMTMRFLADARMTCPSCNGKRFRPHILEVKFLGHSITDVLNLTLAETYRLFANHKRIVRKLQPAVDLGLGYLKLGQPSASLSGGESQRLKMVPFFSRRVGSGTVVILDEPTTGLHFEDVERLVHMMRELVKLGATVIVVEHNSEVVKAADYLVVLGPGSASEGGRVVESFDLEAV